MNHRILKVLLFAWLAVLWTTDAPAQVPATETVAKRPADEAAVQKSIQDFSRAFEAGDAAAAGRYLTSGAELVNDDGMIVRGRKDIQDAFAAHFAEHSRVKIENISLNIRFPSRDTAICDGVVRVTPADSNSMIDRFEIRLAREDSNWLISMIHQWPHEQAALLDLEWMIGTWSSKQGNAEVQTTYEWFGNKSYIRAHFTVREKDKSYTGMQMIGLDPGTGRLRTWIFEAEGGFGEGVAIQDGKEWVFESATLLSTNDELQVTNVLVRIDGDTFTWQPLDLTLNGEQFGNLPPAKVTRVK